jgi:hypothetical protein
VAHFCKLVEEPFNNSRSTRQNVVRYRLVRDGFTHRASDFASRAEMTWPFTRVLEKIRREVTREMQEFVNSPSDRTD